MSRLLSWAPLAAVALLALAAPLPAQEPPAIRQGRALIEAGRAREARQMLRPFAERESRDGAAAFWTGRAYPAEGDFEEAERWLDRAVERAPDVADHHYWAGQATLERLQRGSMIVAIRRAGRVRDRWERALELDPPRARAQGLIGFYLQAPGVAGGSREKAEAQARALTEVDASAGHRASASIRLADGDSLGAIDELRAAVAADPDASATRLPLGLALQTMRRWDDALAVFDSTLRARPGPPREPVSGGADGVAQRAPAGARRGRAARVSGRARRGRPAVARGGVVAARPGAETRRPSRRGAHRARDGRPAGSDPGGREARPRCAAVATAR